MKAGTGILQDFGFNSQGFGSSFFVPKQSILILK